MTDYYCEYCGEEDLKTYYEDRFGSIFCNKRCFEKSLDYRDIGTLEDDLPKRLYTIALKKVRGKHKYEPSKPRSVMASNSKIASRKLGVSHYAMRTYGHIKKR